MNVVVPKALLIGITYSGTSRVIQHTTPSAIYDILAMKALLVHRFGFLDRNILVMSEDNGIVPSGPNIIEAMGWLVSRNHARDFGREYNSFAKLETGNLYVHIVACSSRNPNELFYASDDSVITADMLHQHLLNKIPRHTRLTCVIDSSHNTANVPLLWNVVPKCNQSYDLIQYPDKGLNGDITILSTYDIFEDVSETEHKTSETPRPRSKSTASPETPRARSRSDTARKRSTSGTKSAHGLLTQTILATVDTADAKKPSYHDIARNICACYHKHNLNQSAPYIAFSRNIDLPRAFLKK